IENPRVPGSIPGRGTIIQALAEMRGLFYSYCLLVSKCIGFKIHRPRGCAGSSPASGTIHKNATKQ
ncbi:hypothetical protein, partial [Neptuniibacter sp. UBA847]|uniref:hypothetical protein n=1 Tax=Neptuniibacter sp. UBA847 TaxID=1946977 RepID=UPI0025E19778